jgi:hypothetical protein
MNIPDRRVDECQMHEGRIDDIAKELHKHGGWWKIIGIGLAMGIGYLITFGSSINNKLDSIQGMLSRHEVSMAEMSGRIKACESDISEIKVRHQYLDQSGVIKKVK